jgi:hypothetical protein
MFPAILHSVDEFTKGTQAIIVAMLGIKGPR